LKFLITILFTVSLFSSVFDSETKYINHIIFQKDKNLIIDNQNSATLTARKLIKNAGDIKNSQLLFSIAKSYMILHKYDMAIYYLIIKKGLFPSDKYTTPSRELYTQAINSKNLHLSFIKLYDSDYSGLLSTIKTLLYFDTHDFKGELDFLLEIYEGSNSKIPIWLAQWKYLDFINLASEYKLLEFDNNKISTYNNSIELFDHINKDKKSTLITAQIIKLNNIGSYNIATNLYKKHKEALSFWQKNIIFWSWLF